MNSQQVYNHNSGKRLNLPEPDPENITVLTRNLPNKPILPWHHYDSPWSEAQEEEEESSEIVDQGEQIEPECEEILTDNATSTPTENLEDTEPTQLEHDSSQVELTDDAQPLLTELLEELETVELLDKSGKTELVNQEENLATEELPELKTTQIEPESSRGEVLDVTKPLLTQLLAEFENSDRYSQPCDPDLVTLVEEHSEIAQEQELKQLG